MRALWVVLLFGCTVCAYRPIWNAPTAFCAAGNRCKKNQTFHPSDYGIVTNGNMTWFGSEMVIMYACGLFPLLEGKLSHPPCWVKDQPPCSWTPWTDIHPKLNGGVPQRANLTAHILQVVADVKRVVPDPNFAGYLVIDWEAWRVPFNMNYDTLSIYIDYSIELVKKANPSWTNETRIRLTAEAEFDSAARRFWTATVETIKALRPNCLLGFYSYPINGINQQQIADLDWLWQQVDLALSSAYSSGKQSQVQWNFDHAVSSVRASLAVQAAMAAKHRRVVATPYVLDGLSLGESPPRPFDAQLSAINYLLPASLGVDGVVLWGSSSTVDNCEDCQILGHAWESMGPSVQACIEAAGHCSSQHCHGHGRCVQGSAISLNDWKDYCTFRGNNVTCVCEVGFNASNDCQL